MREAWGLCVFRFFLYFGFVEMPFSRQEFRCRGEDFVAFAVERQQVA